jgi:nitrogen fixation protein FixH
LQSPKPYENGLAFNREIARAKAQSDRQWTTDATINKRPDGTTAISVHLTDAKGSPLRGYELTASLNSPTDIRRDHRMILAEENVGDYTGSAVIERGQWDMTIEARQNGETLYRSVSRIILH